MDAYTCCYIFCSILSSGILRFVVSHSITWNFLIFMAVNMTLFVICSRLLDTGMFFGSYSVFWDQIYYDIFHYHSIY